MNRYLALLPPDVEDAQGIAEPDQAPLAERPESEPLRVSAPSGAATSANTPPPQRSLPASLVRQVAKRLRAGRPVRLGTGYGDVILAPSLDAARWAEERCPGVPVFLPYEWRELLDCASPDEVGISVAVKRHLGARLLPGQGGEEVTAR